MILAYLNEACMLASAVALAIGWGLIRRRQIDRHRRAMLTAAALGLAFFLSYAVHTLLVGDTSFGGPSAWRTPYLVFLQIHTVLATVAGVMGVITIRWALRQEFAKHRRIAPWTASLWLVAAGSGLMVFLMLYVIFPSGPTTNMFKALGH
jgi:putative membrane protein